MAQGIRQYVFGYIHNINKLLANLKQAVIIIARAKTQFSQAEIKIKSYIYNADGRYLDTSKVLKILN